MPGVALRTPTLGDLAAKLRESAGNFAQRADAIAKEELDQAVVNIKRISPVKTGLFRRSWAVQRRRLLEFSVVDTASYASWVHRRGEKGTLFWEAYALPEVEQAVVRARVRIRDLMRESVRASATARLAPTLAASRTLRAMGRLRL